MYFKINGIYIKIIIIRNKSHEHDEYIKMIFCDTMFRANYVLEVKNNVFKITKICIITTICYNVIIYLLYTYNI